MSNNIGYAQERFQIAKNIWLLAGGNVFEMPLTEWILDVTDWYGESWDDYFNNFMEGE